jgi:hypothetical protein
MSEFRAFIDSAALLWRSADVHRKFFIPANAPMNPPTYAGKVDTTCAQMALELLGTSMKDIPQPLEFARMAIGFGLLVRAVDESVDVLQPYTDQQVTKDDLTQTPIFHKYAGSHGRHVTGEEGQLIVLSSAERLIPGNTPGSIRRRAAISQLVEAYPQRLAEVANDPAYHAGDVLPLPTAVDKKRADTGYLGETIIDLFVTALDLPQRETDRELLGKTFLALQFHDDLFDWRKDWLERERKVQQSLRPVRPQENLFIASLYEREEELACENVLFYKGRSAVLAREQAPHAITVFNSAFQNVLDQYPIHPYRDKAQRISHFAFCRVPAWLPESGPVYR